MEDRDDTLAGLDELTAPAPNQNPNEQAVYQHQDLESHGSSTRTEDQQPQDQTRRSPWLTQLYITSYLVFFSILGVLARVGLQALTLYPGAPIPNTDLWANVGGSLIMGLLREDRLLFRRQWRQELERARREASSSSSDTIGDEKEKQLQSAARKSFTSTRAGIPAYVGLSVGFCGSFTSFASICRDAFLAMANNLNTAVTSTNDITALSRSRPRGDSVMAVLAILILEVGLSTVALICGAHLATAMIRPAEKLSIWNVSRIMDPLAVFLGFGCWLGAVLLAIWPIHDAWRGQALFSIVFAPLGCLLRYRLSVHMNKLVSSFPMGTFAANIFGTCVLGMCYDLQMSSLGVEIISCQVLQGVMDGFCGALTTVSTWVLELDTLRLRHAYIYGACSLFVGVGFITAIMGGLRWTSGFNAPTCTI